jgi:hypothetical protein
MTQAVEHLPSRRNTLSSNASTTKKKKTVLARSRDLSRVTLLVNGFAKIGMKSLNSKIYTRKEVISAWQERITAVRDSKDKLPESKPQP